MKNLCKTLLLSLLIANAGCKKNDSGIVVNDPTEGQVVLSTFSTPLTNPGKLMVLDKKGKKIWEKNMPGASIDFRKWQVNGKVRYTYMEIDRTVGTPPLGIWPTTAVVLNESYQEIKRLRLLPFNSRLSSDPTVLDGHDIIFLDDNHYITLAYFEKAVNNIPASLNPVANCKVVAAIIQEVINDQVVWEWESTNFPELYSSSVEGNVFSNGNVMHDYIHMNSMYVDPTDGNLICSNRNSNQILKISRTDGGILWRLGGTDSNFPMTGDMKFLRQHHATLTDNNQTLLLYDNGHITERPFSRVLEFRLNEATKTINGFKAFKVPQNIFSQFMASVQKRGDTYFIGAGSEPKILEVNYITNQINFQMQLTDLSYRAYKN